MPENPSKHYMVPLDSGGYEMLPTFYGAQCLPFSSILYVFRLAVRCFLYQCQHSILELNPVELSRHDVLEGELWL